MAFTSTYQSSTSVVQRDIKKLLDKLNEDIHKIETISDDKNTTYPSPVAPKKPFYKHESIDNKKHSPCKLNYVPFVIFGNTIPSYECAEKKEQKNSYTNLECATIKKNQVIKISSTNGKLKIFRRDIGVGCELRFKRHLNYLNKLFGQS